MSKERPTPEGTAEAFLDLLADKIASAMADKLAPMIADQRESGRPGGAAGASELEEPRLPGSEEDS